VRRNQCVYRPRHAEQANVSPPDRKIKDTIPDNKPPQVTFSCSANGPSSNLTVAGSGYNHPLFAPLMPSAAGPLADDDATGTCSFQFWVDRIESFYCKLDQCSWQSKDSFGAYLSCTRSTYTDISRLQLDRLQV
jgi:hypothetical protein